MWVAPAVCQALIKWILPVHRAPSRFKRIQSIICTRTWAPKWPRSSAPWTDLVQPLKTHLKVCASPSNFHKMHSSSKAFPQKANSLFKNLRSSRPKGWRTIFCRKACNIKTLENTKEIRRYIWTLELIKLRTRSSIWTWWMTSWSWELMTSISQSLNLSILILTPSRKSSNVHEGKSSRAFVSQTISPSSTSALWTNSKSICQALNRTPICSYTP